MGLIDLLSSQWEREVSLARFSVLCAFNLKVTQYFIYILYSRCFLFQKFFVSLHAI